MSPHQLAVAVAAEIALFATALGLIVRGRWRLSWFFAAYVLMVLTSDILVTLWPGHFYVDAYWAVKQVVWDVLKLGLALELGWRTFRLFPGAESTVRKIVLVILVGTALAAMAAPTISSDSDFSLIPLGQIHPRVINGTIWLLAATLALAAWYRVPVHPFHVAILTSYAAYLALFSTLLSLVGLYGWAGVPYLNALDPPAYVLLTCWWAYVAWRPENDMAAAHDHVVLKLKLRAPSCG